MRGRARAHAAALGNPTSRAVSVTALPGKRIYAKEFYMSNPSNRTSMRGQLTLRGVVIGVLGCVIITASSAYTALKMGALPGRSSSLPSSRCSSLSSWATPASTRQTSPTPSCQQAPWSPAVWRLPSRAPGCWAMPTRSAGSTCLSWHSLALSWVCWPRHSSTVTLSWTPRLSSPLATPQLRPCARPRPAARPASSSLAPWPSPASIACCATPWALCPACCARSTFPA